MTSTTPTVSPMTSTSQRLVDAYRKAANGPANVVVDVRTLQDSAASSSSTAKDPIVVLTESPKQQQQQQQQQEQPIAWIVPNILSANECDDLIANAEAHGLSPPVLASLRTSKRTINYTNSDLSHKVLTRLAGTRYLLEPSTKSTTTQSTHNQHKDVEETSTTMRSGGGSSVHSIHDNWRIVRYDPGEEFPAHQDQMDSYQIVDKETGTKDLVVSSHTLLINLSPDGVQGGATRFYPNTTTTKTNTTNSSTEKRDSSDTTTTTSSSLSLPLSSPYDYSVDVHLARGWGLIFRQNGVLHAGQRVTGGSKYVAQSGIMRLLPKGIVYRPSVFKHGPGINDLLATREPA